MIYYINDKRGFVSLIGLLLAAVIILFLCYIMMNTYFKKPSLDKKTEEALKEHGIDTTGYKGILDSTKKKIQDINKQTLNRERE